MGYVSNKHKLVYWGISLSLSLVCYGLKLDIDGLKPQEYDALLGLRKDLGLDLHWTSPENPCNLTGITCQRFVGQTPEIRVTRIVLPSKRLRGFLPPVIAQFSELRELSLADNDLFDRIPAEIGNCKKLEQLNLRGNRFSGEIPSEISDLERLRALDLSANRFSGELQFLKLFPNLESLSVSGNVFNGKIPPSLGLFRNLLSLNLSDNDLEGPIPKSVLRFEFPGGAKVFSGNPKLCGYPLDRERSRIQQPNRHFPKRYRFAENSNSSATRNRNFSIAGPARSANRNNSELALSPSPTPGPHNYKHRGHEREWIRGLFIGIFFGLLSGTLGSLLSRVISMCMKGRIKTTGTSIFSPMIKKAEDLAFLETEDICSLELIGRGGCGEVYKAELPGLNGKFIAIKKINQPPLDAGELSEEDSKLLSKRMKQIRSEIQTVGHIRHRNLLPLLAHVPRPNCHYLVYEFMKNGSLQKVLTEVAEGTRELEWQIRHKIALGIASGLEYLHMHHSPRIIHRDLKPANILLDDDLEARIADFGLAKAVPDANTHVTTSNVAGTVGYISPEYHQTLKFTEKCDIYSFGVVLAVLVSGKHPSDDFFQHTEEVSIVKWLRNVITSETPTRAIDSKLLGNGFEEQMLLSLKVACFCVLDDPKQRPNSKEVRSMLSQIKP